MSIVTDRAEIYAVRGVLQGGSRRCWCRAASMHTIRWGARRAAPPRCCWRRGTHGSLSAATAWPPMTSTAAGSPRTASSSASTTGGAASYLLFSLLCLLVALLAGHKIEKGIGKVRKKVNYTHSRGRWLWSAAEVLWTHKKGAFASSASISLHGSTAAHS